MPLLWVCACSIMSCQAPLSSEFSSQEYWSGLPFPLAGNLPNLGIEPMSPVSPALAGGFFTSEPPGKPQNGFYGLIYSITLGLLTMFQKRPQSHDSEIQSQSSLSLQRQSSEMTRFCCFQNFEAGWKRLSTGWKRISR